MNLSDLNSGPVSEKGYLNPQVGSLTANLITANTIIANTFNIGNLVLSGNVRTISRTGSGPTINLAPSDLISGVIGLIVNGSGTVTVQFQLPTGAALDAALSGVTAPFYFTTNLSAVFNIGITTGNINLLVAGTSIVTYDSEFIFEYNAYQNTAPVTSMNRFQRTLIFARSVSGWTLYG